MITDPHDQLVDLAAHAGLSKDELEKRLGVSLNENKRQGHFRSLVRAALDLGLAPAMSLDFGMARKLTNAGVLGYALLGASTIREVLILTRRYYHLLVPDISVDVVFDGTYSRLRCTSHDPDPEVERFYIEAFFASVKQNGEFLVRSGSIAGPRHFSFSAPPYIQRYREVFGDQREMIFDSEFSELALAIESIDTPQATLDSATEALFREHCMTLLRGLGYKPQTSARVQQLLMSHRGSFPSAPEVAGQLGMSNTTLWRKLKGENTSYQMLLDQVRELLARRYLQDTILPVSEVAELVGFDDRTNFRRAFRRWTGQTPSEMRESST
ncbi:MAG: helix-turn-helix domain-containing protein [Halioglobus sp.]|jgi:AraC-like DNA-binding protein|nr:helix-turn-helix domain-containing protein [Halioglobus sp.]